MNAAEPADPSAADRSAVDLPAAEALRLADRARAAAQAPGRLPGWYGPAFAVAFTVYGTGVGQAIGAGMGWLGGLFGALFAALTGALARVAVNQGGIVHRMAPGIGRPVVLAVLAVILVGLAALLLAWLAGGGARWMGAVAGLAAGAAFWVATDRLTASIRRMPAAR
ncbi:hypothetical protein ABT263_10665 [Kitasatospora sp. NPDC001603]|uniref:hypothetical protein n=1 Tax=Kitasatospora sp. NPDC001603 TaxID=3154388 RepID=UPI00331E3E89